MTKLRAGTAGIGIAFSLFMAGCGASDPDGLPREPVSGDVLLGGKPLERGMIQFLGAGIQVGGMVTDGTFSISRDLGPVPGDYKVAITASSAPAERANMEEGTPDRFKLAVQLIPPRYNARTTLSAKVEKAADNHFKFDLATAPDPGDGASGSKPGRRATARARPRKG